NHLVRPSFPTRRSSDLDGGTDQALRSERAHRLDADGALLADVGAELVDEERTDAIRFRAAGLPLDAGVHVLGVLAEDDDVDLVRLAHGRGHARYVAHGS